MPKRTNTFQSLVATIERQLGSASVRIEESEFVDEPGDDTPREADIHITIVEGIRTIRVAVECIDHRRKADVTWIDKLIGKYTDLPVDKVVAVSRSGFTEAALKKAARKNIDTLSFGLAASLNWKAEIAALSTLVVRSIHMQIGSQTVILKGGTRLPDPDPTDLVDAPVFKPDGTAAGSLVQHLFHHLHSPTVQTELAKMFDAEPDAGVEGDIELAFGQDSYIVDAKGVQRPITGLIAHIAAVRSSSSVQLEHASYGPAHVAYATSEAFGGILHFTYVQEEGKAAKAGFKFMLPRRKTAKRKKVSVKGPKPRKAVKRASRKRRK